VLANFFRQGSLVINGALERNDDRDSKMSEQTDKIARIRLNPGTKAFVDLRQKKTLEVDDHPAAAIGDNVSHHSHVAAAALNCD
jgi:predicted metalloprotease